MAAPPAPVSDAKNFNLIDHLKVKFGVGPQNWDTFQTAARDGTSKAFIPSSGAHITLKDLSRDPASVEIPSNDDPAVRAALEDDGGWVGVPDPTKFAPGTMHLSPNELKEEVAKGNVVMWKDFKKALEELSGEEREVMEAFGAKMVMQQRRFVTLKDGSKVSLWDLYQYVYNNPELAALYDSGRAIPVVDPEDPAGLLLDDGGAQRQLMEEEQAEDLDWGQVAEGAIWRRRPTRWLGGLDGVKDWDVGVFTHEPLTNCILGGKYAGRNPYEVAQDPSYARDVLRCGPLMSMTFVLTAARDLQLQDMARSMRDMFSTYLQRQAPLSLPRRLRPDEEDPTDLTAVNWTQALADQLLRRQLPSLGGSSHRPLPLGAAGRRPAAEAAADGATGEAPGAGGGLTEVEVDELGVSWRQMDEEEHKASVAEGLETLKALPEVLCPGPDPAEWPLSGTSLVDSATSRSWQKGSSLWVTLEPEGGVVLQARSPAPQDGRGEQESFWLTRLEGQEALSGAVMEAFLGPQPVDPLMAVAARSMMLVPANGFLVGDPNSDPNHPMHPTQYTPVEAPKAPTDASAFRLASRAELRQLQPGQGPTLVAGIRSTRVVGEVTDLLSRAAAAAADAAAATPSLSDGSGADSAAAAEPSASAPAAGADEETQRQQQLRRAREAAVKVLREGMTGLGPEARSALRRALSAATDPLGEETMPIELAGLVSGLGAAQEEERRRPRHVANGAVGVGREVLVSDLFSLARGLDSAGAREQQG